MAHNHRIQSALDDLHSQARLNIAATAKKYEIARKTLADQFHGKSTTIEEINSYVRQRLTQAQEEALITYFNKLNDLGFPPTPKILKNMAESISHTSLGPNWVNRAQLARRPPPIGLGYN
jgi:hypothetical protein